MVWAPGFSMFAVGAGSALFWACAGHPKHRKVKANAMTPFCQVISCSLAVHGLTSLHDVMQRRFVAEIEEALIFAFQDKRCQPAFSRAAGIDPKAIRRHSLRLRRQSSMHHHLSKAAP